MRHKSRATQRPGTTNTARWLPSVLVDMAGKPCILCQNPSTVGGVFAPDNPQLYGAPVGKKRYLAYPLCARCYALPHPERCARIEAALRAGVRREQAQWN